MGGGNPMLSGTPMPPPAVRAQQGPFQGGAMAATKKPGEAVADKLKSIGKQLRYEVIPGLSQLKPSAMPIMNKILQGLSELMNEIVSDKPMPGTTPPASPPGPEEIPPPMGESAGPEEGAPPEM